MVYLIKTTWYMNILLISNCFKNYIINILNMFKIYLNHESITILLLTQTTMNIISYSTFIFTQNNMFVVIFYKLFYIFSIIRSDWFSLMKFKQHLLKTKNHIRMTVVTLFIQYLIYTLLIWNKISSIF